MIDLEKAKQTITALMVLAECNIPPDIQELLVHGDPMRGIPPNALSKALGEVLRHHGHQ